MAKLSVEVVTPERRVAQVKADEVIAPGAEGLFGVRVGHTAYLALLQPGELDVRDGVVTERYFVSGGFAEVSNDVVRVLADSAELLSSIDPAAAQKRVDEALKKLGDISPSLPEYAAQAAVVKREQVRLSLAGKK